MVGIIVVVLSLALRCPCLYYGWWVGQVPSGRQAHQRRSRAGRCRPDGFFAALKRAHHHRLAP